MTDTHTSHDLPYDEEDSEESKIQKIKDKLKEKQIKREHSAEILKAAKKYAEQGCSVIPVEGGSKKPLDFWKEYQDKRPTDT